MSRLDTSEVNDAPPSRSPARGTNNRDPGVGVEWRWLGVAVAVTACFALLAQAMWRVDASWGSAYWPSAGVTFGALALTPRRWWTPILIGVFVAEYWTDLAFGGSRLNALFGGLANVVEPVVGVVLFQWGRTRVRLGSLRDLMRFVVAGALIGPMFGLVLG